MKLHSVVVTDEFEVCGLITGSKWTCCIVEWSDCRRTQPFERSSRFYCQQLHRSVRSTEDAKIFQVVSDQPTVSHRRSSRMRGVRRHLVRKDNESTSTVRSQCSHHSSALHARS